MLSYPTTPNPLPSRYASESGCILRLRLHKPREDMVTSQQRDLVDAVTMRNCLEEVYALALDRLELLKHKVTFRRPNPV